MESKFLNVSFQDVAQAGDAEPKTGIDTKNKPKDQDSNSKLIQPSRLCVKVVTGNKQPTKYGITILKLLDFLFFSS